jgi:hypothetical protein
MIFATPDSTVIVEDSNVNFALPFASAKREGKSPEW